MTTKNSIILAVGLLAAGLAVGLCLQKSATLIHEHTVAVRGLSEREVEANKVTWPVVYKIVGNDLQDIYRQIESNNEQVSKFLLDNGLTADEISVGAPKITDKQADTYSGTDVPYRYSVTGVTTVTSGKVDLVRSLITRQGQLLRYGIAVIADDWQYQTIFEYTGLNDIKPEMIADATRNAREAAEKFAQDSGCSIGRMTGATQGQFSIEDRDPYTPYIKKIRVVTNLTYEID